MPCRWRRTHLVQPHASSSSARPGCRVLARACPVSSTAASVAFHLPCGPPLCGQAGRAPPSARGPAAGRAPGCQAPGCTPFSCPTHASGGATPATPRHGAPRRNASHHAIEDFLGKHPFSLRWPYVTEPRARAGSLHPTTNSRVVKRASNEVTPN